MTLKINYPTELKRILIEQGRKQGWLARKLYITESTVNRWVNGHAIPQKEVRQQVAVLLGIEETEADTLFLRTVSSN